MVQISAVPQAATAEQAVLVSVSLTSISSHELKELWTTKGEREPIHHPCAESGVVLFLQRIVLVHSL